MGLSLSVIVTTFNEAENIGRCLNSVAGMTDDILVVDSFSTDDTVAVAQQYGARIEQRTYNGPAEQKNWAIPQAKHEWVLLLDADEELTERMKLELQQLIDAPEGPVADMYWIKRNNYFMGQRIRYSGWQGDKVVRFFHRDKGRYNKLQVHEEIVTEGYAVGQFKHSLNHYTFRSLNHYLDKTRRYARWSAKDYLVKTPRVNGFHLFVKPLFRFFKHYVLQQGVRDGKVGFILSVIMAWGVFLRYAYIQELQSNKVP